MSREELNREARIPLEWVDPEGNSWDKNKEAMSQNSERVPFVSL